MIIALLLLVVSAILIIVALIVLRFTISFTISSEFREIGVMKAIGLGNLKIRSQYLVKYLAISAVGAVIGTALSFPFGNLLTDISSNSVMVENEGSVFTNIICAIAVIAVIMLFAFICTRKANKLSPVDAIRNGQTGERFKRKGFLHLSKSRLGTTTFMAANDVMSAPKRFLIIIVVFALTILPIQFLDICADTLNNKQMLSVLGCVPSDVAFSDSDNSYQNTKDGSGRQMLIDKYKKMEQTLADNGIPARVFCEQFISCKQEFNGKTAKALSLQGVNNKASEHKITKGSAPQNKDEIAIQPNTANDLGGAEIGDTITVTIGDKKYDLIISGFYEAMTNMGQGIRFHEDLDINYNFSNGTFGGQIQFTDDPSDKEIDDRIEKIKDLFPDRTSFEADINAIAADTASKMEALYSDPEKEVTERLYATERTIVSLLQRFMADTSLPEKEAHYITNSSGFKILPDSAYLTIKVTEKGLVFHGVNPSPESALNVTRGIFYAAHRHDGLYTISPAKNREGKVLEIINGKIYLRKFNPGEFLTKRKSFGPYNSHTGRNLHIFQRIAPTKSCFTNLFESRA